MVILYDRFNMPTDVFELIFATKQQEIVGKALVEFMKDQGNEITKTEMSLFATQLHEGKFVTTLNMPEYQGKKVRLSYNKRQFYDRILTPLKGMGFVEYDLYRKVYKLSENFNKDMIKIGLKWLNELRKAPHTYNEEQLVS